MIGPDVNCKAAKSLGVQAQAGSVEHQWLRLFEMCAHGQQRASVVVKHGHLNHKPAVDTMELCATIESVTH